MYHFNKGPRRKNGQFFNNISQMKNRAVFHCIRPQKGWGQRAVKTGLYKEKG
jgi:hypothetical protein